MRAVPLFLALALALPLAAQTLPDRDRRNIEIRHLDAHFTLDPEQYPTREAWLERAAALRRQILFAAGLDPMPAKTDLDPRVFGRVEHEDYTVQKVLLETYPGFYLGGNLYRPRGRQGPFPAVVSPHGHWAYGRLEHQDLGSVPARAISLARQGYVVLTYDMVGFGDTRQLPHERFGDEALDLWGVGPLGLQLWNSIRAVDFLQSLNDVDSERIAATGASGGGTQTFLLAAVDDRIRYAAPVNMVSGIMQGGSVCENAPNLRIDTNNVEIAALIAPRPLFLVAATGDWTRNVPEEELPAIRAIYELFSRPDRVDARRFDSPHNYHLGSREAVYAFFGREILGDADPRNFREHRLSPDSPADQLALWGRSLPEDAVDQETFLRRRIEEAEARVSALRPTDAASLAEARERFRGWLELSLMAAEPAADAVVAETVEELPNGEKLVLGRPGHGDRIPGVALRPTRRRSGASAAPTLLIHPDGGAWALSSSESRAGLVAGLIDRGGAALAVDLFQTGHAVMPRDIAGAGDAAERFYTTYNRTDFARRVQDILTASAHARARFGSEAINWVCLEEAGPWCYVARALATGPVRLFADLNGFDPSSDEGLVERAFAPHLRRAGDFRGASTLVARGPATVWNAADGFPLDWLRDSYSIAGTPEALQLWETGGDAALLEALERPFPTAETSE